MLNRIRQILTSEVADGPRQPASATPLLSIVVIVYDMPLQAENTLRSLTPGYQLGVAAPDYEVIVVENQSPRCLRPEFIASLPDNFSYYLRDETEPTPVHAINFAVRRSRGRNICIMIDGARLVTPGVIKHILLGHRLGERTVVTVPGYHIGFQLQQDAIDHGYDVEEDQQLIRSIDWPGDGYRLFEIACFSGSSAPGFFLPNSESNCISIPRAVWEGLGELDGRFNLRGGGLINLDLYKRACEYPGIRHVILPGEGTFHQFHGGVTTGGEAREARERFIEEIKAQYREIRGEEYHSPDTRAIYLGELPRQALKFVHFSAEQVL
jgi:hypothetical protein